MRRQQMLLLPIASCTQDAVPKAAVRLVTEHSQLSSPVETLKIVPLIARYMGLSDILPSC